MSLYTSPILLQEAAQKQARLVQSQYGEALPASIVKMDGQIATVKVEVLSQTPWPELRVPIATSPYDHLPLQKGDVGWLAPVTYSVAFLAALSTERPQSAKPACNMSAYVFVPLSSAAWEKTDPGTRVITGHRRVQLRNSRDAKAQVTLEDDKITLSCGGTELVISASGITLGGVDFKSHTHQSGQPGAPTSGVMA